jgi:hypothetical protein
LKAPNQIKTLEDLMMQASHYAEFCMRNSGSMPPTLFLIGNDGPMMFLPEKLADDQDKDDFATTSRLICIAHNASACVMALEAWMKAAKQDEKMDMTELPSEAIDRQEVIVLMGDDRKNQIQKFLPIIRSDNGKFFNLNESGFRLSVVWRQGQHVGRRPARIHPCLVAGARAGGQGGLASGPE